MLGQVAHISETAGTIEEMLDRIVDFCIKEINSFQTFSVFVDRGSPTFAFVRHDKKVLLNLSMPWESIAGRCIKEKKRIAVYAPHSTLVYKAPAVMTGFDIRHLIAIPLTFLNTTFACLEVFMESDPEQADIDFFTALAEYLAPVLYLQEWHALERRKAHAIKNKAFVGVLTLFDEEADGEEKQQTINDSFHEISLLCEDYLKLGSIACTMQKTNLGDIVATVSEKLGKLATLNNKQVLISHDLAPDVEVFCDDLAIREEVLFNIIKNVWEQWEQTGKEDRAILFKTYKNTGTGTGNDNCTAVIEIHDNAGGIPAHLASRFFRPFETSKGIGRGMGMSVAYQVVKHHKGDITFQTREGEGTTFFISLRCRPFDE